MVMRGTPFILVLVLVLATVSACVQSDIASSEPPPDADSNFFRCEVQPVIAARCSFMECHGSAERAMPIFAEQRYRLGISWDDYETPLTADELAENFRVVRGFFARPGETYDLLSEKPLDTRAGGLFHRGKDLYGRDDVFLTRDDAGYAALRKFIDGATADPSCEPTEEVGL